MPNYSDIEAIQVKVRTERGAVLALDAKIKDEALKKYVERTVTFLLHDIESLMLPGALKAVDAKGEAMWVRLAEEKLHEARTKRLELEREIASRGGPENAVLVG